jgi:hypothetical protein
MSKDFLIANLVFFTDIISLRDIFFVRHSFLITQIKIQTILLWFASPQVSDQRDFGDILNL